MQYIFYAIQMGSNMIKNVTLRCKNYFKFDPDIFNMLDLYCKEIIINKT